MLMRSELGTLATGKTADIIAVPGNPFGNITMMENVSFFTKAGTVCKSWFHSGYWIFWLCRNAQICPYNFGLFLNFPTLPGLRPAAAATPVGIETIPKQLLI